MISGMILAAGKSSRMGRDKLSLAMADKSVIEYVILAAKASKLGELILVWGAFSKGKELAEKYHILAVQNERFEEGMSTSVAAGMERLSCDSEAVMFLLGDMPFVTAGVLDQLIDAHKAYPEKIIVPLYGERRGNPVIFPKKYYGALQELEGDQGARGLIQKHITEVKWIEIEDTAVCIDIDTQEEYIQYLGGDLWKQKK